MVRNRTLHVQMARKELLAVLEYAPNEVHILIQVGKINKKLNRTQEAVCKPVQMTSCTLYTLIPGM